MSRIIIVDFRDDEDFANHPYISYLKQTNIHSFIKFYFILPWNNFESAFD